MGTMLGLNRSHGFPPRAPADFRYDVMHSKTVVIVDTSNEIAGDGNIPHREAIGESRRIMVPVKADQHK